MHVATPDALSVRFWHPDIAAPFALKLTVPDGVPAVVDVTVAEIVAVCPNVMDDGELVTTMDTLPFPTVTFAFDVPERKVVLPL